MEPTSQQDQKPQDNKLLMPFLCAMGVILILLLWIIFRKPEPDPSTINSKQTRDSITLLTTQIDEQKSITDYYLEVVDSMKALPPRIKIIYREQKNFTLIASLNQLDSIVLTSAGLKTR
jgi:hypothetical protein